MEQCPKCGFPLSDGADPVECPACGVVIAKYVAHQTARSSQPAVAVSAASIPRDEPVEAQPVSARAREAPRGTAIVVGLLAFLAGLALAVAAAAEYVRIAKRGLPETSLDAPLLLLVAGVVLAFRGLEYTCAPSTFAVQAPRRPWIAAGLTLFLSGLGHLYAGEPKRALGVFLGGIGWGIGLLASGMLKTFIGLLVFIPVAPMYLLWAMRDAVHTARKGKDYVLRPYNRWYLYLAVIMAFGFLADRLVAFSPVRSFRIASSSMGPALLPGDRFVVDMTCSRSAKPARGDLVAFTSPDDPARMKTARVIGLEGEQIEIRDGQAYIDGQRLSDPWGHHSGPGFSPMSPMNPYTSLTIPSGTFFVLGDNREASYDSRFFGPVPLSSLRGRLLYVYWSSDKTRIGTSLR